MGTHHCSPNMDSDKNKKQIHFKTLFFIDTIFSLSLNKIENAHGFWESQMAFTYRINIKQKKKQKGNNIEPKKENL